MINKQNLWFLTLFSLILVLSIYYITMPNEALKTINNQKNDSKQTIEVDKSDVLTALRVDEDEQISQQMTTYQDILLDDKASVEQKNEAYEAIKQINQNKGKEQQLEQLILEEHKLKSFIKIKDDQIQIVISNKEHNSKQANKIIRTIQSQFDKRMFITVKFQS